MSIRIAIHIGCDSCERTLFPINLEREDIDVSRSVEDTLKASLEEQGWIYTAPLGRAVCHSCQSKFNTTRGSVK